MTQGHGIAALDEPRPTEAQTEWMECITEGDLVGNNEMQAVFLQ